MPRMYGADWKMPKRKAFTPEGVTLGAWVTFEGDAYGQVWAPAPGTKQWWVVVEDGRAYSRHESALTVIGQCVQDELPIESTTDERTTYVTTATATRTRKPAAKPAPKRVTRKTAASKGKTAPVPAVVAPRWEDRKAARRALAAELRAQGIKATPEVWAAAKAERGIK